ncbi:nitroreductase [Paenibacillus sp. J45TS6]|uniref:nitroreductase family protein n=1 Tax=unclassified Paenibacillus TaxID=185978 RepID=UPI001B105B76|nr:nitroreductase family protein [Paenibacillus sp. J45TS6]GIP42282.1 nitroreductase [Paenibacillus sp. J45TS6]
MGELQSVIKERRSAMKFQKEVKISKEELSQIFAVNKYAPSAFNLQHAHYVVLTTPEEKALAYEASGQYKVQTASAVIIVLGDTKAYKQVGRINEGMLTLGMMSQIEYDLEISSVTEMYESRGPAFQREEAIRNASLSAMQFMLIAKDMGWDTCPMIGYDEAQIASLLQLPAHHIPVMMMTMGKADESKVRPRGYRKPVDEFVTWNSMA